MFERSFFFFLVSAQRRQQSSWILKRRQLDIFLWGNFLYFVMTVLTTVGLDIAFNGDMLPWQDFLGTFRADHQFTVIYHAVINSDVLLRSYFLDRFDFEGRLFLFLRCFGEGHFSLLLEPRFRQFDSKKPENFGTFDRIYQLHLSLLCVERWQTGLHSLENSCFQELGSWWSHLFLGYETHSDQVLHLVRVVTLG